MKREFLKNLYHKIKYFFINHKYILLMALPFFLLDIATRFFGKKINFFTINKLVPNLFTIVWIFLFIGACLSIKKKYSKWHYFFTFFGCFFSK